MQPAMNVQKPSACLFSIKGGKLSELSMAFDMNRIRSGKMLELEDQMGLIGTDKDEYGCTMDQKYITQLDRQHCHVKYPL